MHADAGECTLLCVCAVGSDADVAGGAALGSDAVEALLFLGQACKEGGRLAEAEAYASRLLDVGGSAKVRVCVVNVGVCVCVCQRACVWAAAPR